MNLVAYRELHTELREGEPVILTPLDHPSPLVSNTKPIVTSPVKKIGTDEFWTENTHYYLLKQIHLN